MHRYCYLHVLQGDAGSPVLLPYICKYRAGLAKEAKEGTGTVSAVSGSVSDSLWDLLDDAGNLHINGAESAATDSQVLKDAAHPHDSGTLPLPSGAQGDQHYIRETVTEAELADIEEQQEKQQDLLALEEHVAARGRARLHIAH